MPPLIALIEIVGVAIVGSVGTAAIVAGSIAVGLLGAAVLGGGLLLGSLFKPKTGANAATAQRLNQTLFPDAFRIIVFGNTLCGNDIRYWEVYGTAGYDEIIAAATHKINSFGNLYIEGALVPISSNNATGTFAGALSVYYKTQGITATGVGATVGGGSLFTSAASFTGCAYYLLKWTYSQKTLPAGIPSRVAQIVEGCPVYDPRKDGTNGGTGSHRANDITTWDYNATDSNGVKIGRNNALQVLTYLLGWTITNPSTAEKVLVFGRGVDPADIDYANWIAAANICETQQYYTDCVLSTGDSHTQNEAILTAGSQGYLLDNGGLWSYHPANDDTASIAVAFTASDIISGISWNPKSSMANQYNQIGGTFVDPTLPALYQSMPYPIIKDATYLTADNNYPKRQTLDFQCVQSASAAQKLARINLNRSRLSGQFAATFNYKALQANNYDCVTLTFPGLGFVNKLFRIISMSINPIGGVDLLLNEESSAVYTGGSITSYNTPGSGTAYDPRQAIALGNIGLASNQLANPATTTAYDGIAVSWTQTAANVKSLEIEYQQNLNSDPRNLSGIGWSTGNFTDGAHSTTDRSGGSNATLLTRTNNGPAAAFFVHQVASPNFSGKTVTGYMWLKKGTLVGTVDLRIEENNAGGAQATNTITLTTTWTLYSVTGTFAAGLVDGLRLSVLTTNGSTGQTIMADEGWIVVENNFAMLPKLQSDRSGIVIPNILPATNYVVRARTISINDIVGPWSVENVLTSNYTTNTQNLVFNQPTDPASGGVNIPDGAVWSKGAGGGSFLRVSGSWVQIAASVALMSDGDLIQSFSTPGAWSCSIPANALGHIWLEYVGGGGQAYANSTGPVQKAAASGALGKHFMAVTPGTTVVAGTLGSSGGTPVSSGTGANGGDTTVTSPALTAHGGHGSSSTVNGTGQTATGGSLRNVTGNSGSGATPGAAIVSDIDSAAFGKGGTAGFGTPIYDGFGNLLTTIPEPPAGTGEVRVYTKT